MKKSNKRIHFEPTDVAPSKIVPPIEESLPMPERIATKQKSTIKQNSRKNYLPRIP